MKTILILGAGFGGVRAALDLEKRLAGNKDWQIVVVDRNSFQTFTPNLYEIASAVKVEEEPYYVKLRGSVAIPYGHIFKNKKIDFIQADIRNINLSESLVTTGGGEELEFEYLVIALGAEVNTFGTEGVLEYAYKMKTVDDGVAIHKKLHELFKRGSEGSLELPIHIVIGGGGFTGVETAAELACCSEHIRKVCQLSKDCQSITLVEAAPQILPFAKDAERTLIRQRLKVLGIKILENKKIKQVKNDKVILENGELFSHMTIWSGGIQPNYLVQNLDSIIREEQRGFIKVNQYLQVQKPDGLHQHIFVVGDNAFILDPKIKKQVPAMAYTAITQAQLTANNIVRHITGRNLESYKPWSDVWIAPVGGKWALAHINGFSISGVLGWIIRQSVDLRYFLTILPPGKALRLFFRETLLFAKND